MERDRFNNKHQDLKRIPQGSTFSDPGYPAADGLAWKVTGPPNAFKNFIVVANKDGSCTEEHLVKVRRTGEVSQQRTLASESVRRLCVDVPRWWCIK